MSSGVLAGRWVILDGGIQPVCANANLYELI